MDAQGRAHRIWAAWRRGNSDEAKLEIENFLLTPAAANPSSALESEEHELLESIVLDLWSALVKGRNGRLNNERLNSNLTLLQHLSERSVCSFRAGDQNAYATAR